MNAHIHFARVNKPERVFVEQVILCDDGNKLVTRSEPPLEIALAFSRECQVSGFIKDGDVIRVVEKHHFYQEWFDILAMYDGAGNPFGWYCDIATPLLKKEGAYYLRDLLLDLWIWPDGRMRELDWDEFEEAYLQGWITPAEYQQAKATLKRIMDEAQIGIFPHNYMEIT